MQTNEEHQLRIARDTLRMPDAMVGVMGGPSKATAAATVADADHSPAPVKHSLTGRGTCAVCGASVESKTLRGIYRHAS